MIPASSSGLGELRGFVVGPSLSSMLLARDSRLRSELLPSGPLWLLVLARLKYKLLILRLRSRRYVLPRRSEEPRNFIFCLTLISAQQKPIRNPNTINRTRGDSTLLL